MNRPGARSELISELRRIGPRYADAAEALGITVRFAFGLPGLYAVDVNNDLIITSDSDDKLVWAALAHWLALEMGMRADMLLCLDVAEMLCQKSGTFLAFKSA